ncbi:MAG: hypothetical protein EON59_10890 [Alphaproteobacteria bacterium]|nr:MAG: hypothetical protein EON59_10890 [Alphaproteobacteria bacterium]
MDATNLAITLFLFSCAVPFAIEAIKMVGKLRLVLGGIATIFIAAGLLWSPIAAAFPKVAGLAANIVGNPFAWFLLFGILFMIAREWWSKRYSHALSVNINGLSAGSISDELKSSLRPKLEELHEKIAQVSEQAMRASSRAEAAEAYAARVDAKIDHETGRVAALELLLQESRSDIDSLTTRANGIDERFRLMTKRIRLDYIEEQITLFDPDLYHPDGAGIDQIKWSVWENKRRSWHNLLVGWSNMVGDTMPTARDVIEYTPPTLYYGDWSFKDTDFPNSDAIHKYKTYCLMRNNYLTLKSDVFNLMQAKTYG